MAKIIENIANSENFKEQGYQAIDKAERSAKSALEKAEWGAKASVDRLADTYDSAVDKASGVKEKIKQQTQDLRDATVARKEQVESAIKARPIVSSVIAFGVGMVLQRLLLGSKTTKIK